MNQFICELCNNDFLTKQHLDRHKNRKFKCNDDKNNINNDLQNKKYPCELCNKSFCRYDTLNRHMKNGCRVKKKQEKEEKVKEEQFKRERDEMMKEREMIFRLLIEKDNKIEKLIEQHNEIIKKKDDEIIKKNDQIIDLIKEIKKPSRIKNSNNKICNNANNNTTTNSNNVNTVNIQITQFGKEDFTQIDDKHFQKIVKNPRILGLKVPEEILKLIHFNPDYPQFNNFYVSDYNREKIMIHDGETWNLESPEKIKSVLEQIISFGRDKLEEYKEKNLSEDAIKRLKRIEDAMDRCDDDFIADLQELANEQENNKQTLDLIKDYLDFQKKVLENIKKTSYNEGKKMLVK
jgi:hypothetical protein